MPADLQALVGAPAWRWTPGMRGYDDAGRPFRVRVAPTSKHDGVVDYEPCPYTFGGMTRQQLRQVVSRPDITDPATLGCMRALARKAWADPTLHVVCVGGRWWAVSTQFEGGPGHETEGDALAAAILVASALTHG